MAIEFKKSSDLINALAWPTRGDRPVVFVLGSGLTVPRGDCGGVPDATEIVRRMRIKIEENARDFLAQFDEEIDKAIGETQYKAAFKVFGTRVPQHVQDQVIRQAVLEALRITPEPDSDDL